jgi:hypothetical protein
MTVGSKAQVYHGTATRTAGGLKKDDLMKTAAGRIVSKKQHEAGLKAINRLKAQGYVAKKGEFKLFTKKSKKSASTRTRAQHTRSFTKSVAEKKAATRASKKASKANNAKVGGFW